MKQKVTKIGDKCRHCQTPVIKRNVKLTPERLLKKYYYTAFLQCPFCKAMYMQEEFKIINYGNTKTDKWLKRKQRFKELDHGEKTRKSCYKNYLESVLWKNKRAEILKTNPSCYCCEGKVDNIHHRNYANIGRESKRDLIPLCFYCHQEVHKLIINKKIDLYYAHEEYKKIRDKGIC